MSSPSIRRTAALLCAFVLLVPCLVLPGWSFGIETLKSVVPGFTPMNPATALGFLVAGIGLALALADRAPGMRRAGGLAVCALGSAILATRYLLGLEPDAAHWFLVDRWLFGAELGGNVMAPTTAFCFVMSGLGLVLLDVELAGGRRPAQNFALLSAIVAASAFAGYLYGIERLYRPSAFIAMALHTAITFLAFAAGLLCVHPDRGLAARITSAGAGGAMLRRLLPLLVAVPLIAGWLCLFGQRKGYYDPAFGFAVFLVAVVAFVAIMLWRNAGLLDRKDLERNRTGEALRQARDELETRVKVRTEDLSNVLARVHEVVAALQHQSQGILRATSDVAASAAETAAAVAQTTATAEEVKQTAQVSTERVRSVSDGAQRAADIAHFGRGAVEETSGGIGRIHRQMENIAASMMKLSEQTLAIGDIITAVGGLAEQSNLLAVNASIEAAKAAQYGKGFSVVAQEVRSLASQSKRATVQVRAILGEIGRAASAAMMATEQGSKAVEDGLQQSQRAGEAIARLADTISDSAEAAATVTASSQQQAVGMDQVARAIRDIQQASARNAAAAKEIEESARSLNELGLKLKALVEEHAA